MTHDLIWQPSLLDGDVVEIPALPRGARRELADGAWVDHVPGWCRGADALFAELLADTPWSGREVRMYDRVLPEPRLTHRWHLDRGPDPPPELLAMAADRLPGGAVRGPISPRSASTSTATAPTASPGTVTAWPGSLPEALVALVSLGARAAVPAAADRRRAVPGVPARAG